MLYLSMLQIGPRYDLIISISEIDQNDEWEDEKVTTVRYEDKDEDTNHAHTLNVSSINLLA